MGGDTVDREASPWLKAIAEETSPGPGTVDPREAIARVRQEIRARRER